MSLVMVWVKCTKRLIKIPLNAFSFQFAKMYTMSPPNTVNMLWLIPQYFLISVAEIMFGVAGLEFSFTQVTNLTF